MRQLSVRLVLLFLLAMSPLNARGEDVRTEERWYIVELQGQRSGWMRERVTTAVGRITTESEMKLTIKRGEIGMDVRVESGFIETPDGKPISMTSSMQLGALPTRTEYRFEADGVRVFRAAGKKEPVESGREPLPEQPWFTPRAADRLMAQKIAAGETEITLRSLDGTMGLKVVSATSKLDERTTLDVVGKTVPAIKWTTTTDIVPDMKSTAFTDERGRPLRTETNMGGMKLTVLLADKDLALSKLDPPELLVSTLIKPDRPIAGSRTLRSAVYLIESTDERLPDLFAGGPQKFDRTGEKTGRLTINLDAPAPAPADEAADARFTDCTTMVSCDDEKVKALAAEALRDAARGTPAPSPAAKAEILRSFVHDYISKKSFDVGFASAAEVARTRTGDCSEHGVLLAALLRTEGIPSRVMSGLVYVDGFAGQEAIFGFHMWAQALLEVNGARTWVDLDAALSGEHPSDATHISLAPASLADGDTVNSLVRLAPLIGTLKITVEQPK